jgi:transcriptional regulator GlxA family with amidase domain
MPTRLGYLLIDGFALMSYAPVIEPFRAANRLSDEEHYIWRHYSVDGKPAQASNGIALAVDGSVDAIGDLDMLFVCAGGNPALFEDSNTFAQLRRVSRFGTSLAGVSGAPFILARAGLLDGYRCTVHWEHEAAFLETFAAPRLERGLFVIDRDRISCAGGLAGLDLAAVLISRKLGAELARRVSDWYIQTEQRQGGGPQRSPPGQRFGIAHQGLGRALSIMETNPTEPFDRASLASIAGVSVRQLERLFAAQLGTTPAAHHQDLRLDRARRLLLETTMPIAEIGTACGFASASHFSREFKRYYSRTPSGFRQGSIVEHIAQTNF